MWSLPHLFTDPCGDPKGSGNDALVICSCRMCILSPAFSADDAFRNKTFCKACICGYRVWEMPRIYRFRGADAAHPAYRVWKICVLRGPHSRVPRFSVLSSRRSVFPRSRVLPEKCGSCSVVLLSVLYPRAFFRHGETHTRVNFYLRLFTDTYGRAPPRVNFSGQVHHALR